MRTALRAYLLGMTAPAAVASLLLASGSARTAGDPWLALILVVLSAIATNYPVMVTPGYKAHAAPAIGFAIVLLLPAAPAVALVGLGALAGEGVLWLRQRRALIDVV